MTPSERAREARCRCGRALETGPHFYTCEADTRAIAQAIKDAVAEERERWDRATLPSGDTKAAYHGEFETTIQTDRGECDVMVRWTTIKEIMRAIRARSESADPCETTCLDPENVGGSQSVVHPCPHGRPSWQMCPHCLGTNAGDQMGPDVNPQG